ncbi:MAG: nitroreductase family protein [Nitrososphaeraceae archaeon]
MKISTDNPIHELISKRWSARAFSTRLVEKSKLLSILEAARWAPSSQRSTILTLGEHQF